MKKKLLIIVLLLVSNFNSYSQNYEISYDFLGGKLTKPNQKLTDKNEVIIKLNNFNPFLYGYTIETKTETYNSEIPELLKNSAGLPLTLKDLFEYFKNETSRSMNKNNNDVITKIIKQIWEIELFFLKFYDKNYVFKETDKIPDEKLKTLKTLIKEINNTTIIEPNTILYIERLKSYYRFNAFFNKSIFNKEINLQQIGADALKISFVFNPKNNDKDFLLNVVSKDSIGLLLPIVRKKGYYSYSTGLFYSNLNNPSYYIAGDSIDVEEGSTRAYGYNALVHYLFDRGNTSIGFHAGLGVPFKKEKLKVVGLTGLTLGFGKKNRILFNTGITFGMTESISKTNYKDFTKKPVKADLKTVNTYSKLKTGFSFSINYNLNK